MYLQKENKKSTISAEASFSKAASNLAHRVNITATPKKKNPKKRKHTTTTNKPIKAKKSRKGKENKVPEPSNQNGSPVSFWSFSLMDVHRAVWT